MPAHVSYPAEGHHHCFELDEVSFWYRHRNRCLAAVMAALPPAEPLFDIGGGSGVVAIALQNAGQRVFMVEPLVAGARHAKLRGVARVICSSLEQCGLRDGTLPSAALFDVLEHIPDDLAFLRQMRSHLSRGARLYITVPAYQALWSGHDSEVGHHRRYTAGVLARRVAEAGFTIEYASHFFTPLPFPIFFLRTLPERLRGLLGLPPRGARQRRRSEHLSTRRSAGATLEALLRFEATAIRRGWSLPFGSSVLLVARAE